MRFPVYLAIQNLLRHPGRNLLYILGVSITAALLLDMILLSSGLSISVEKVLRDMGYEVRISPRGTLPFETDAQIRQFQKIAEEMRQIPAIAFVDAMLGANISVRHGNNEFSSFLLGLELHRANAVYRIVAGSNLNENEESVLVNRYVARDTGIQPGDVLSFQITARSGRASEPDYERMPVSGIVDFPLDGDGQFTIFAPLNVVQKLQQASREDPVSVIMVKLKDSKNAVQTAGIINERFPQLSAYTISSVIEAVDKQLSYFKQFAYILGGISLIVTFVLIFIITTISFHDRVGEIALLRAIGLSGKTIAVTVLFEGIFTSLASAGLGFVLGKLAAIYLDSILTSAPGLPENFSFFVMEPGALMRGVATMLFTGFFAGIYPATAAARLPVAQTMREEIL